MAGVLAGVRVADFGQYIAGPLAAMLLSDQGAEVIRVETPGGPRMQTPANRVWNRGKRSIVLDLKQAAGHATAQALMESADVVIENFRPGVMDRFGLGAAAMTEANPRLIYCSMPGFAGDDPRRDIPGWEGVIAAAASTVGRGELDEPAANGATQRPIYTAIPAHSSFAAFWTSVSVAMALNARERDGVGQIVEVPLFDATFTALGYRAQKIHDGASGVGADMRAAMGRAFGRAGAIAGVQRCKDGRYVYVHPGNKNIGDFMRAIGADRLAGDDPAEQAKALFLTRTAKEWEDLGAEVRTEVVACRSTEEWISGEQAQASSMLAKVADEIHGEMVQPGLQVHLDHCEGEVRPASAPDADRAAVLASLKRPAPAAARPAPPSPLAALAGKKVLDLCIVLAGPTCGRTLAEFGANVIKIERPPAQGAARQLAPVSPHAFNIDINRGKRSLVIDLKTPAGLEVFNTLVKDADVVVQNFRHGVNERLGFGYEAVRKINPNIVYASLNMYGYDGPWAVRPGHEQLGQMGVGPAVRYGGDGEPLLQHVGAINDYGTGLMGAYAVALALYHRERTGEGGHVWTSLAHTAQILQSPFFYDYAQREPWDEARGQDAWGASALQRYYAASDGWIFFGAASEQTAALARVEGLEGFPVAGSDAEMAVFLAERLARAPAAVWTARLAPARIGVHALARLEEVMADAWVRDHGLIISREHKGIGLIDQAGPPPRLSRTPVVPGVPAPPVGSDGREILAEHGLDPDALAAAGAVVVD
ncbi:MAG TPA: CoA transferase [Caulobacteraceae bacterium]|nr:CoA transferase [Caulobacteraceae bacterium]